MKQTDAQWLREFAKSFSDSDATSVAQDDRLLAIADRLESLVETVSILSDSDTMAAIAEGEDN